MPRILRVVLVLVLCVPLLADTPRQRLRELFAGPAQHPLSVLFVGNSLTAVNDLPMVVKQFAAGSPRRPEIAVRSLTPGGALLSDHWRNGQVVAELSQHRPDVLVLQGQSTEPLYAPQDFTYYARLFKAEADRVHTTTVLFSTWPRPLGDPYYRDPTSGGSPTEMQTRLNAALAAAVLFRVLFPTSPASSTYYAGLPQETALSLQRVAAAVPVTPSSR